MNIDNRDWLAWVVPGIAITVVVRARGAKPPNAKPAAASPAEFSSGRAMAHVLDIARAPHPTGSREAERVREGVITKLANLGLTAEIQIQFKFRTFPGDRVRIR